MILSCLCDLGNAILQGACPVVHQGHGVAADPRLTSLFLLQCARRKPRKGACWMWKACASDSEAGVLAGEQG